MKDCEHTRRNLIGQKGKISFWECQNENCNEILTQYEECDGA